MSDIPKAVLENCVPEVYYLPPTHYVPNSPFPYLVYRNVLPTPLTEGSCEAFIGRHGWTRTGPVWRATSKRHFHPNVHECYGILSGTSEVLMGIGTEDNEEDQNEGTSIPRRSTPAGLRLVLKAGDVVVHPAGVAHSNVSSEGDYKYLAFFPENSPKWKSETGSTLLDLKAVRAQTMAAPVPQDPVLGGDGHLRSLWKEGQEQYEAGLRS